MRTPPTPKEKPRDNARARLAEAETLLALARTIERVALKRKK